MTFRNVFCNLCKGCMTTKGLLLRRAGSAGGTTRNAGPLRPQRRQRSGSVGWTRGQTPRRKLVRRLSLPKGPEPLGRTRAAERVGAAERARTAERAGAAKRARAAERARAAGRASAAQRAEPLRGRAAARAEPRSTILSLDILHFTSAFEKIEHTHTHADTCMYHNKAKILRPILRAEQPVDT